MFTVQIGSNYLGKRLQGFTMNRQQAAAFATSEEAQAALLDIAETLPEHLAEKLQVGR